MFFFGFLYDIFFVCFESMEIELMTLSLFSLMLRLKSSSLIPFYGTLNLYFQVFISRILIYRSV